MYSKIPATAPRIPQSICENDVAPKIFQRLSHVLCTTNYNKLHMKSFGQMHHILFVSFELTRMPYSIVTQLGAGTTSTP